VHIIGVIDLKDGTAVHARGGRRDRYAAVQQSAGASIAGRALTLARHYVETFGLTDIYLADLDAITSRTPQIEAIRSLTTIGASLQIDAGIVNPDDAQRMADAGADAIVVGLETLPSFDALASICTSSPRPVIFSLDLREGTPFTGGAGSAVDSPETIAAHAVRAGVQSIVVLDVARVGTGDGPDLRLLQRVRAVVPATPVYAGGGIRDLRDLEQLARIGCAGALVATAIHEGRLTPADIDAARGSLRRP
jgi:phosphoribosylformimino-5-aminoimidazole carboxamide ribotide isomerase